MVERVKGLETEFQRTRFREQIALVDELAHTNVPGSERTKRWEDVH
jgi:K+-sensing histidine kinase KdpD